MKLKIAAGFLIVFLLSGLALAQAPTGFLDVFTVKVKPEKRAEFDAVIKKLADANRKQKGSNWIASEVVYGEGYTILFSSARENYAAIEQGSEMFMGAMSKTYGRAGAEKILQDFNNCITSSRSEIRRRRMELSANPPADMAAMNKLAGDTRWVRTVLVRIRPGRTADYEARLRENKAANEKANPGSSSFVSQSVVGTQGTVFYISSLQKSLAGFDNAGTPLPQVLGQPGYEKYLKTVSEVVIGTETMITRLAPELSNPPEEVAAAAPDFWKPKTAPAPAAKATTESGNAGASKKK